MGLLDQIVALLLVFRERNFRTVFHGGCIIYTPTNSVSPFSTVCLLFLTPSPAFVICGLFDDGHSDWCVVTFTVVLICISLLMMLNIFSCACGHLSVLLEKCLSFAHFLTGSFVFLMSCMSCLYISEIKTFFDWIIDECFLPFCGCLFTLFMVSFAVPSL